MKQLISKRKALYDGNPFECELCQKPFETEWEQKKHKFDCRLPEANRIIVKMDDKYSCSICFREHLNSYDFKKHLFLRHSDLEVRAKYNRTME